MTTTTHDIVSSKRVNLDPSAKSGESFRRLTDTSACAVLILRSDGDVRYSNQFLVSLSGVPRENLLNKGFAEVLLAPQHRIEWQAAFDEALSAEDVRSAFEFPIVCHDRSTVTLEWTMQRLDGDGDGPVVVAVGNDVNQRSASDGMLRSMLETAVDGIVTISQTGIVQSMNPAAEEMFGYGEDEVVGENISMLMPHPYQDEHDGYLTHYMSTGEKRVIGIGREAVGLRKSGKEFPCDLVVSEMSLGSERFFTGTVRDITKQKDAETRARQAERLAAIGQTVAGLAHESRNAFQRSQACLEMLALELESQPDAIELVERTQRALSHLHHLYEEVRNYAAPITLDRQECNLAHVWRDAWAHLEPSFQGGDVTLHENLEVVDPICSIDWFALGQVFRNIFENSIFACESPGRIEVRCQQAELNKLPAIRVTISDNGPGLSDESMSRVFDAFFTTKPKGTGLGMAIAKRIIDAHEGTFEVGNRTLGAEFVITLKVS